MRNVFDQYSQPENRLTHALVSSLAEDRRLLARFTAWATGKKVPNLKALEITEQRLAGDIHEINEDEAEKLGLPDAWIHDGDNWSLLIESKVKANLKTGQLRRHYKTAMRRGFTNVTVLALDTQAPRIKLPNFVRFRQWSEVYEWLCKQEERSDWAGRTRNYMETCEAKMIGDGYLTEGKLTKFTGIPFSPDNPYHYAEARRLLGLMTEELRSRKSLIKGARIDAKAPGRGAITGKRENVTVWDLLRIKGFDANEAFTRSPHFTLAIGKDHCVAILVFPNSMPARYRKNLLGGNYDEFLSAMTNLTKRLNKAIKHDEGASPRLIAAQRRYPSRLAPAFHDAKIDFDLRTAIPLNSKIKHQPQWLEAAYEALRDKKSNYQVAIGAQFFYERSSVVSKPQLLDRIEDVYIACEPLIKRVLQKPSK